MKKKTRKILFIVCGIVFIAHIAYMTLLGFVFREDIANAKMYYGVDYVWHLPNSVYLSLVLFLVSLIWSLYFQGRLMSIRLVCILLKYYLISDNFASWKHYTQMTKYLFR